MITNDSKITMLKGASEETSQLEIMQETVRLLQSTRKKYNIHSDSNFIEILDDIILGFYPKSDLRKLLMENIKISEDIAQKIEFDLKDFLAKIDGVPSLPSAPKDIKDPLELRPEGVPVGGTSQETETTARPITREQLLTALTAKRTMAGDIASIKQSGSEEVPGYEAYRNVQKSE